jgi:single-strand DNA-binding protein
MCSAPIPPSCPDRFVDLLQRAFDLPTVVAPGRQECLTIPRPLSPRASAVHCVVHTLRHDDENDPHDVRAVERGATVNVIALTGRIVSEPTRRETRRGVVATFRIGTDGPTRLWVDVECWGHLAGRCATFLRRGRRIGVNGSLVHDEWTDREGGRRDRWFVRADRVTFLDAPADAEVVHSAEATPSDDRAEAAR